MTEGRRIGLFAALRISSITSLVTILFGVGTNKLLAVHAGPEGVALIGLYRTLTTILVSALALGLNEVLMQRLSTTQDPSRIGQLLSAGFNVVLTQSGILIFLTLIGAPLMASFMFGSTAAPRLLEVRLVVLLATGVLLLQSVTAALNGLGLVREVNRVGLTTSLLTLLTTYPFLLLGSIGLSFLIGATCYIGAAMGVYYLLRTVRAAGASFAPLRSFRDTRKALPFSGSLALLPIWSTGSVLIIQSTLARDFGTHHFGLYAAASMLESTSMLVLTSSMRSYLMPQLGRLSDNAEKRQLVERMLTVLLGLLLLGASTIYLGADLIIRVLFSGKFADAKPILYVLTLSMPGQIVVWFCAMYLFNQSDFRIVGALEVVVAALRVVGTLTCVWLKLPIVSVAWVHAAAFSISGVTYVIAVARRHGHLFGGRVIGVLLAVTTLLALGVFLCSRPTLAPRLAYSGLALVGCAILARTSFHILRGSDG
jgi:O-antigen/teichoic acid export membrane protein